MSVFFVSLEANPLASSMVWPSFTTDIWKCGSCHGKHLHLGRLKVKREPTKTTKILRSYFLGWEKNLWPWKTLLLPPHNWGETSIFSGQFGLLNCKDDVCITSKNATTIQCYHLHLPTCSVTSDKWQFFGWHAASVHGYRGTKYFLLTAEVLKLWTDCPAKNSFEQKVVLISRGFLQTSGNSR